MNRKSKRKRFSIGRVIANVFALLVLGAIAAAVYLYLDYRRFADAPLPGATAATQIDIPIGTPLTGVVNVLGTNGLQPGNVYYWRLLARQMDVTGKLHAGEYAIDAGMSPRALLRKMAAGEVIQHHFTIVEGWTFAQLRAALSADKGVRTEPCVVEPFTPCADDQVMQKLGEADVLPEGEFLPETYSYVKGMSDLDILRRAHAAMRKTLDRLWAEHAGDTPLTSAYQALTLASIVEKETGRADERPRIARVFLTRLKLGMKLQTDPSVIYGLGSAYEGKIHRRDLDTDTPFNTYTRGGLPPTPIAMPGKAALEAVIHPAETDALYFVSRGDGSHEFSPTLEAHNLAVAKYQLHRN